MVAIAVSTYLSNPPIRKANKQPYQEKLEYSSPSIEPPNANLTKEGRLSTKTIAF